jgi:FkbM family methyltransferase
LRPRAAVVRYAAEKFGREMSLDRWSALAFGHDRSAGRRPVVAAKSRRRRGRFHMRWKVSRFSLLHNTLRVIYNNIFWRLPVGFKYGLGKVLRARRLPYRLLENGSVVVQIGCPWDILHAGRSRGIYFSIFSGKDGRVVIIEPDADNVKKLQSFMAEQNIGNITVVELGAWSGRTRLRFLSDPAHPAANLIEDVFDSKRTDLDKFSTSEIEVDAVDNILDELGISGVDLVSITTNGSESEILKGMTKTLRRARYVSIIPGKGVSHPVLAETGFQVVGEDDRGLTYGRQN